MGKNGFAPPEDGREGLELGYHIFRPWRRMGYGLEGCQAVLDWEEKELALPVYVRIRKDNLASLRLAEKLGFSGKMEENGYFYLFWPPKEAKIEK